MSKEIVANNSGLPAAFLAGIENVAVAAKSSTATAGLYLKMNKGGVWSYSREETPAEDGALYAINYPEAMHGYSGWGDAAHNNESQPLGDVLVTVAQLIPGRDTLSQIDGTWSETGIYQLACIEGSDKGMQFIFKTNSGGGIEAFKAVLAECTARVMDGEVNVIPIVKLSNTYYKHSSYGRIYKPVFDIVDWAPIGAAPTAPDDDDEEDAPVVEAKPEKKKKKKKKKAAAEPVAEVEAEEAEEPDAPPRRRRRKAA